MDGNYRPPLQSHPPPPLAHQQLQPPHQLPANAYQPYWGEYEQRQQHPQQYSPQQYRHPSYEPALMQHHSPAPLAPLQTPSHFHPAYQPAVPQQQQQHLHQQWDTRLSPEEQHSPREQDGPAKKKRVIKKRSPPPEGVVMTEKSCLRCRVRKVKCDRMFPCCNNCKIRNEECDLISLHPKDKQSSSARDQADMERIARLEARLAELEGTAPNSVHNSVATATTAVDKSPSPADSNASPSTEASGLASPHLALAQLKALGDIGHGSVDWRLATPQMAKSLSQHLCDAFFTSCCVLLPAFSYYRVKMPQYKDGLDLPDSTKVAIAAFCAVGARASPHSAVLGIEASPSDAHDHPQAPLVSAGARRHSACAVLLQQAHSLSFEHGLMDEPTVDNLAGILALMQMIMFAELQPKKSRALLRAAVGHYKELQDAAGDRDEADEVQKQFGLAVYTADALSSAYARRSPLLTDADVAQYFARAGIVVPTLPGDDLVAILRVLLDNPASRKPNLKTALHLITCWTAACQRIFAKLAAPSPKSPDVLAQGVKDLFSAIDAMRASIQYVQALVYPASAPHSHPHMDSKAHPHSHEDDHLALAIRNDRDLLDLFAMTHVLLRGSAHAGKALDEVKRECESRMRRALRVNALYAKLYTQGTDGHMVFHSAFQLELTPNWTKLALQKYGEPDGPACKEDEVTDTELSWLIEALQIACYYTPAAERRLGELSPRFGSVTDTPPVPNNPFPSAVRIVESESSRRSTGTSSHTPPPGFSLDSYAASPPASANTTSTAVDSAFEPGFGGPHSASTSFIAPYEEGTMYGWNGGANGRQSSEQGSEEVAAAWAQAAGWEVKQ